MKKFIVVTGLSVILMTACVSVDTHEPERDENNETETMMSSIESIEQAMEDHSYPKETIVHYELKALMFMSLRHRQMVYPYRS